MMHCRAREALRIASPALTQPLATGCIWAFVIYIVALPAMQWILFEKFGSVVTVADGVFLAAGVLFVAALIRGELPWQSSRFLYLLGAYAGTVLLSVLAAPDLTASAGKLSVEAYVLTTAALTFNVVRSERVLKLVVKAWMAGAALAALAGIIGIVLFYGKVRGETNIFLSHYGTLFPGNYPRSRGLFLNANMCCNYLSVSFLLLLAMRSLRWIGRRSGKLGHRRVAGRDLQAQRRRSDGLHR